MWGGGNWDTGERGAQLMIRFTAVDMGVGETSCIDHRLAVYQGDANAVSDEGTFHHALKGHMSCSPKRLPMFPDKFLKAHWLVTRDVLYHAIRAGENACRRILPAFKEMLVQEG